MSTEPERAQTADEMLGRDVLIKLQALSIAASHRREAFIIGRKEVDAEGDVMTATPPRADLRTLAAEGDAPMTDQVEPSPQSLCDHPVYVHHMRGGEPLTIPLCQICGAIGWDDLRGQMAEHRRMVLGEAAEAIDNTRFDLTIDGGPATGGFFRPETVLNAIRRLAAAAPPAGLSAPVPAEDAPAVPEEADGQRAGQGAALNLYEVKVENEGDFRESLRQYDSRHLGHLVARRVSAVRALVAELRKTRAERDRLARELHEAQMMIERLTADDARDGTRRAWLELEHWRTVIVPELMEQRDRLGTDRDRLAAQVDRVRALHTALDGRCVECVEYCDCLDRVTELGDDVEVAASARMCNHGQEPWPCPTITAVDALPDAGTGQTEDHDAAH